jgi:hypothetical protein
MSQTPPHSSSNRFKIVAGLAGTLVVVAITAAVIAMPASIRFHATGPANTGHETVECSACHKQAPGTVRQQLQAKLQYLIGRRTSDVTFGTMRVQNEQCVGCHARGQDMHPVHRFLEPRFAQARAEIGANSCVSCHREHKGVRVTMAPTACASCHQDLALKSDPLDVSHRVLVQRQDWSSCLGCHDFHGNHKRSTQTRVDARYPVSAIADYFAGGPSPYGRDLKFTPKQGGQ